MKIGYARVSTDDQNPALRLAVLKRAGCKRIFTDKTTGAHVKRECCRFVRHNPRLEKKRLP